MKIGQGHQADMLSFRKKMWDNARKIRDFFKKSVEQF